MEHELTIEPVAASHAARERAIPWYLWCAALAVTSAYVGGYWDISWHRSIGRDSFWSPPHMAIYACGFLAGISCGYLIFATTFNRATTPGRAGVHIWGLVGPLGAFIAAWGGLAMLVSAPFDNWWHNAYGLDVRIISPPHIVLALGFFGIELGTVILLLAFINRAGGAERRALERLLLYVGGTIVSESLLLRLEYIHRSAQHSALFFIVVAIGTPMILTSLHIASGRRWACATLALIYSAFGVAFLWILPLVPAEPKLGPVYRPVTHMIPWEFPLLVVAPAFVLDLVLEATRNWKRIARAAAAGGAFFVTFVAVQWPFATFLMSPAARNRFFGTIYMDYGTPATSAYAQYRFIELETAAQFRRGMVFALFVSCLMAWLGLVIGRGMQRVKR